MQLKAFNSLCLSILMTVLTTYLPTNLFSTVKKAKKSQGIIYPLVLNCNLYLQICQEKV